MEARMKRAKVAYDIKTHKEIVLLNEGDCVPVVSHPDTPYWQVAPGRRLEGITLTDCDCEILLTVNEVAERVDRSEGTILRWLADGVLKGEKVSGKGQGGQWRIPLAALDNLEYPKPGPKGDE
jgi:excisionase family DNA binding protein